MPPDADLMRGTLELLLLAILSGEPMYGYEICRQVRSGSGGYFDLREGSLYPALHRLERAGGLDSSWQAGPAGRRRRYYRITEAGRTALGRRRSEWRRFAAALEQLLEGGDPNRPSGDLAAPAE